jgi:hypothetical protein
MAEFIAQALLFMRHLHRQILVLVAAAAVVFPVLAAPA